MTVRGSRMRDTYDYEMLPDGRERKRTFTYTRGGWWRRTLIEETGRKPRVRHYVWLLGYYVRVPWLAWAMFS